MALATCTLMPGGMSAYSNFASPDSSIGEVILIQTIAVAAFTAFSTSLGAFLLARDRMQREFRLHYRAEAVARELLRHPLWKWRSFKIIRHHLGGFNDDDLRKILVQAGAIRFETVEGDEIWGLYDRVSDELTKGRYPIIDKPFSIVDNLMINPDVEQLIKSHLSAGRTEEAVSALRGSTGIGKLEALQILSKRFGGPRIQPSDS